MRRSLLIVGLGITFLILMTWFGTIITTIIPRHPTASVQTSQAGPYQIILRVDPNPPLLTQPATLSVQVLFSASQQPVTDAHVQLKDSMQTMDMGTDQAEAKLQGSDGTYLARVQFSMSGLWQIRVIITRTGAPTVSTLFEVTAQ